MNQRCGLAFLGADGGPSRLEIATDAATGDFPVSPRPRQPHLEVVGPAGGKAEVGGAEVQDPIGQLQRLKHGLCIRRDLLVRLLGVIGVHKPIQLHLVELVQADQATGVAAVAAGLTAEAGAVSGVAQGQLICRDDFIPVQGGHRHLSGWCQPEVVLRATEAFLGELGQLS